MARPLDLVPKTDVTIRIHPEHAQILEKLVRGWSLWAWSVAELTARIVSTLLSQSGKLDMSEEMKRILEDKVKV